MGSIGAGSHINRVSGTCNRIPSHHDEGMGKVRCEQKGAPASYQALRNISRLKISEHRFGVAEYLEFVLHTIIGCKDNPL